MNRGDEPPVDQECFLPDGARAGVPDGRNGVEEVAAEQDPAPEPRPPLAQSRDDAVVEAVDGAACRGPVQHFEEPFVPLAREALDLDPDLQPLERYERLLEGRERFPIGESMSGKRSGGQVGEPADARNDGIVVDQEHPVAGGVDVELDPVGAQRTGPAKGCQ